MKAKDALLLAYKHFHYRCGLLLFIIASTGCVLTPSTPVATPQYYLIDLPECKETELSNDLRIVACASRVEEGLRQRYNNARLARTQGGLLQVITAGASSLITGLGGPNGVTAGSILAGIS